MFFVPIKTVITFSVLAFLGLGFAMAVAARFSDPTSGYELAAREKGGVYMGVSGVMMQDKINNCGPAALKMILDAHGKKASLRDLENGGQASAGGWSMQSLKEIAGRYGLQAEGWKLNWETLCKSQMPAILFVENRHFVVVDGMDAAGFFSVRDPAIGQMKIHRGALRKIWKGEALLFGEKKLLRK